MEFNIIEYDSYLLGIQFSIIHVKFTIAKMKILMRKLNSP
jgi:hypothetical protein